MPAAEATSWMLFLDWIGRYRVGDLSSMLGVLISVVGFVVTVWNVLRSKAAAVQAREAAEEARRAVGYADVLAKVPRAVSLIEEIKRLHREQSMSLLVERYAHLRTTLIEVAASIDTLTSSENWLLQKAIQQLETMEGVADRYLQQGHGNLDVTSLNEYLNRLSRGLIEMQVSLQKRIERAQ